MENQPFLRNQPPMGMGMGMQPMQGMPGMPMPGMPMAMPVPTDQSDILQMCQSPAELLNYMEHIFVKQKAQFVEHAVGVNLPNTYYVYNKKDHSQKKKGHKLFVCEQKWRCCELNVKISAKLFNPQAGKVKKTHFLSMVKDCQCCTCRPVTHTFVVDQNGKKMFLGSIRRQNICSCTKVWRIYEAKGENLKADKKNLNKHHIFEIVSPNMCKCRLCTKSLNFKIWDEKKHNIGSIKKIWAGFLKEAYSDADNFSAEFPKAVDWKKKALLMTAILSIDFEMFEKK